MISMQVLYGVLVALAILIGAATALSVVMLAATSVAKPGQAPHGGIRRDLPPQPQPEPEPELEPSIDDARELVLV